MCGSIMGNQTLTGRECSIRTWGDIAHSNRKVYCWLSFGYFVQRHWIQHWRDSARQCGSVHVNIAVWLFLILNGQTAISYARHWLTVGALDFIYWITAIMSGTIFLEKGIYGAKGNNNLAPG